MLMPIEARTFGLEGMFRQLYPFISGQNYVAEDADALMGYRRSQRWPYARRRHQ